MSISNEPSRHAHHAKHTTMRAVMTLAPHTITSDQTLSAAHRMMTDHELRHLPVLRDGKLVGVLSERDLYLLESMAGVDAGFDRVIDAMTADVYTATSDTSLHSVAHIMAKKKYGCVVVTEDDRVVGVFTVTDAVRHLEEILA